MGNFEKLSVLVIVVIIVMILVVALYTWTDKPEDVQRTGDLAAKGPATDLLGPSGGGVLPPARDWPDDLLKEDEERDEPVEPPEPLVVPEPEPPTPDPAPRPVDPDPLPAPAPAPAQGPWDYEVKEGDTLSQICERELGSWRRQAEVLKLNPGLDPLALRVGQKLKMPARGLAAAPGTPPAAGSGAPVAPTPAVRGRVAPGDWYVVQRGDRLSTIAKRAYGSIDRWPELWARNLSVVKDPDDLVEGTRIFIPK